MSNSNEQKLEKQLEGSKLSLTEDQKRILEDIKSDDLETRKAAFAELGIIIDSQRDIIFKTVENDITYLNKFSVPNNIAWANLPINSPLKLDNNKEIDESLALVKGSYPKSFKAIMQIIIASAMGIDDHHIKELAHSWERSKPSEVSQEIIDDGFSDQSQGDKEHRKEAYEGPADNKMLNGDMWQQLHSPTPPPLPTREGRPTLEEMQERYKERTEGRNSKTESNPPSSPDGVSLGSASNPTDNSFRTTGSNASYGDGVSSRTVKSNASYGDGVSSRTTDSNASYKPEEHEKATDMVSNGTKTWGSEHGNDPSSSQFTLGLGLGLGLQKSQPFGYTNSGSFSQQIPGVRASSASGTSQYGTGDDYGKSDKIQTNNQQAANNTDQSGDSKTGEQKAFARQLLANSFNKMQGTGNLNGSEGEVLKGNEYNTKLKEINNPDKTLGEDYINLIASAMQEADVKTQDLNLAQESILQSATRDILIKNLKYEGGAIVKLNDEVSDENFMARLKSQLKEMFEDKLKAKNNVATKMAENIFRKAIKNASDKDTTNTRKYKFHTGSGSEDKYKFNINDYTIDEKIINAIQNAILKVLPEKLDVETLKKNQEALEAAFLKRFEGNGYNNRSGEPDNGIISKGVKTKDGHFVLRQGKTTNMGITFFSTKGKNGAKYYPIPSLLSTIGGDVAKELKLEKALVHAAIGFDQNGAKHFQDIIDKPIQLNETGPTGGKLGSARAAQLATKQSQR